MAHRERVGVVVCDDSYLVRVAVQHLLEDTPDLELLATAVDTPTLLAAVREHRPDVVVTDVRMPPDHTDEGVRAAQHIRDASPRTGVVVLSQHLRPEYVTRLFAHGVSGLAYLLKDRIAEEDELAAAVREVARGGSVIDPLVVAEVVRPTDDRLSRLTARELDVLREMARGRNNGGIGAALSLTERAVAKHINSLFTKLDLHEEEATHRRVQAVLVYLGAS